MLPAHRRAVRPPVRAAAMFPQSALTCNIWRREGSKRQRGVEAERQWRTRERERGAAALEREDWEFER